MTPTNDNASAATSEGQHKITVCIKPLYMALFKMQPARGNRHLTTRTSAADQSSQVLLSSVIWMQKLSLYQKRSVNTICANHKHNKSCQLLCELAVYCTHLWGFLIPELEAENINSEMMCCICRSLMYCDLRLSFGRPSTSSLQAPLHSLRDPSKPHVSLPYTHVWVKMMACACQYSYTILPQPALDQHEGRGGKETEPCPGGSSERPEQRKVCEACPTLINCYCWWQETSQPGSLSAMQEPWSGPHFNPSINSGSWFDELKTILMQKNLFTTNAISAISNKRWMSHTQGDDSPSLLVSG